MTQVEGLKEKKLIYSIKGKGGRTERLYANVDVSKTKKEVKKTEDSEESKEENTIGLGDALNFDNLYKKGKKVVTTRGSVNKSGMVGFIEFMDFNKKGIVSASKLTPLSNYSFKTELGFEDLTIRDVFNNIHNYERESNIFPDEDLTVSMGVMVPNFDQYEFKNHHALMLIDWYSNIKQKIAENSEEKEKTDV